MTSRREEDSKYADGTLDRLNQGQFVLGNDDSTGPAEDEPKINPVDFARQRQPSPSRSTHLRRSQDRITRDNKTFWSSGIEAPSERPEVLSNVPGALRKSPFKSQVVRMSSRPTEGPRPSQEQNVDERHSTQHLKNKV